MKIFVHPGFGKCASSSLQAILSNYPNHNLDSKSHLHYLCIGKDSIIVGEQITNRSRNNSFGYLSSANASVIAQNAASLNDQLLRIIDSLPANDVIILSCEGWCGDPRSLKTLDVLSSTKHECIFISFVRAPVSWINSAFWQWGAWSDLSQADWITKAGSKGANWFQALELASREFPLAQHKVIPLTRGADVITAFFREIGMESNYISELNMSSSNVSLPLEILHLYLRFPDLRPTPHASAIDFRIARLISSQTLMLLQRKPWAITKAQVSNLIDLSSPSISNLSEHYLSTEAQAAIGDDDEWTSPDAYADRDYVSIDSLKKVPALGSYAAENLLKDMIMGIK